MLFTAQVILFCNRFGGGGGGGAETLPVLASESVILLSGKEFMLASGGHLLWRLAALFSSGLNELQESDSLISLALIEAVLR